MMKGSLEDGLYISRVLRPSKGNENGIFMSVLTSVLTSGKIAQEVDDLLGSESPWEE